MPTTAPAVPPLPPALQAYAQRHGLDATAFAREGRLRLRVDARYRVLVYPAADGRLALTARLLDLAEYTEGAAEDLLLRLAALGAGLLRDHACTLCIDAAQRQLQVQQILPAAIDAEGLEAEMADFLNSLAFWSRACDQERAQLRA